MKMIQKQTKLSTHDMFFIALSVVNLILTTVNFMFLIRDICEDDE